MKGKNRSYSIIIVSDATSESKDFFISSKLFKKAFIAISVFILLFGYIIFDYLTISIDRAKMKRLETEAVEKNKIITKLTQSVDKTEKSLMKMRDFKKKILVAAGLTSPNALKAIGTGGGPVGDLSPDVELLRNRSVLNSPLKSKNLLEKAGKDMNEAKKIENTLKFVEDVISKQKVRLASTPSIWPTNGYLSHSFGRRIHPFTGKRSFHYGQDIATQSGNRIVAPANGVILVAEYREYYGKMIIIDHNFGYTTRFGHLAAFNVKEGQRIKRGQVIGYVGSTGRSTGPHLHYEVRFMGKALNPMNFIID